MNYVQKKQRKVVIITNHSYMLWQFRRELIAELMKEYEIVLSMPFVGHEEDLLFNQNCEMGSRVKVMEELKKECYKVSELIFWG